VRGERYLRTVQAIVASAVVELFAKAVADTKDVVWGDCYVAAVIETMEITAEQEAVIHPMFAAASVRLYVGSLQDRCRMLVSDCAGTVIGVPNRQTE